MKFYNIIAILFVISFFSCDPDPVTTTGFTTKADRDIFVLNEGAFGSSNAELTYINLDQDTINGSIYQDVNLEGIGDVLQSAIQLDDEIWMVVNGSAYVLVLDAKTMKMKENIELLGSPRYIAAANDKVYITDLGKGIHVIDQTSYVVEEKVNTPGWTEEIISSGDNLYVVGPKDFTVYGNQVYKIDSSTDEIIDSVSVSFNPISITLAGDHAYVICSGNYADDKGGIFKIDLDAMEVAAESSFNDEVISNYSMKIRNLKGQIIYMSGQIFQYTDDSELATDDVVFSDVTSAYGLEVNDSNDEIYVLDAIDYSNPGKLKVFNLNNSDTREYTVGINPNGVLVIE